MDEDDAIDGPILPQNLQFSIASLNEIYNCEGFVREGVQLFYCRTTAIRCR